MRNEGKREACALSSARDEKEERETAETWRFLSQSLTTAVKLGVPALLPQAGHSRRTLRKQNVRTSEMSFQAKTTLSITFLGSCLTHHQPPSEMSQRNEVASPWQHREIYPEIKDTVKSGYLQEQFGSWKRVKHNSARERRGESGTRAARSRFRLLAPSF
ncbi:hypothetical protein AOLI_G00013010 [Acnodon oligacanthus]